MDERWSRFVQHADMLDSTRAARFAPRLLGQIARFAGFFAGKRHLELGCGTGALARALARRYPRKWFAGLDRDTAFIKYARTRAMQVGLKNLIFVTGDVYALPFADESFDGTLSHTVLEHVDAAGFFAEQLRVLRPGGQSLTLSVFPSTLLVSAEDWPQSEEEKALSAVAGRVWTRCNRDGELVARHALAAHEIPPAAVKAGFADVEMAFFAVSVSLQPGDEASAVNLNAEEVAELANFETIDALEAAWAAEHPGYAREWTPVRHARMAALVRERYARRRACLPDTWAANARMMMAVRGVKPE